MRFVLSGAVVAGQRASPMVDAGGSIVQNAGHGFNIFRVKIDQMRLIRGVGIMAGGASSAVIFNVFPVKRPTIGEITIHHRATMTFVTQCKVCGIISSAVGKQQRAFDQWFKGGAVRALGAGAAISRALIVVMAIGASNRARRGQWQQQAGVAGVLAGGFHGMERNIAGIELAARVGFHKLTRHARRSALIAVAVAAITKLIFVSDVAHFTTAGTDTGDAIQCTGNFALTPGGAAGSVGVVTVSARHMTRRGIDRVLSRRV